MKIFSYVLALVILAAEDVTAKATIEPEESNCAFLYGNPKPTYKFMTMGKIIIYFSDETTQEIS